VSRNGAVHLLIDGHNVIHQDVQLRALMANPEEAHREFERLLEGRRRVTIFYDGGPGGHTSSMRRSGSTIDYSGSGSADDRIVRWLLFNPNVRALVITNDRALCARVRTLGAKPFPASRLLDDLRKERGNAPASGGTTVERGPLGPAEVEEWIRIFGLTDE
jgi:predicted RNA-binding protein with PIN domain